MVDWAEAENRAARQSATRKQSSKRPNSDGSTAGDQGMTRARVENPYCKGSIEPVAKRDTDPIERMFSKGMLDDGQHRAAHIIRGCIEEMGTSVGTIDPARIRVDGGGAGDATLYMLEAAQTLNCAKTIVEAELGKEGWDIVRRVAGYGESVVSVALDYPVLAAELKNGGISREARSYVNRTIQRGLKHVAGVMVLII